MSNVNCYRCGRELVRKRKPKNPICYDCKKEYMKEYDEKHKDKRKEYNEKNKDKIKEKRKEYYQENKEDIREQQKEYRSKPEVKERQKEYQKEYRSKPEVKERRNERRKERRRTDIEFNIACRLRNLTRAALKDYLKGKAKQKSTVQYLGCSIEYFKEYFESKFTKGMTWEEFLKGKIHIDHIIPCKMFDLNIESEREKCFHYTNLQPLWAEDNLKKGAKLPTK